MAGILPSYIGGGGGLLGLPYDPFEALRMGQLPQTTMGIMPGAPVADPWPSAAIPPNAQPTQAQPQAGQPMPTAGQPAPQLGFLDKIGNGIAGNSNFLLGLGAGLLSGDYGQAGKLAMAGGQIDTQNTNRTATAQALQQSGIPANLAPIVAANPSLLTAALKKQVGGQTFGLSPIYGKDAQGNTVLIQTSDTGDAKQTKVPEGITISSGVEKMDAGTHYVLYDKRTGNPIGMVPKDIAGAERAKKVGAGEGEAQVSLTSLSSKMPGLETVVKELDDLAKTATYTSTGQLIDWTRREAGLQPREASVARARYISMVDNQILPLLRDTFGAAFTEREGQSLKATLGAPNLSPIEKQAVLRSFIEQKRRDIEALQRQSGVAPQTPSAGLPATQAPASLPPPPAGFRIVQ